MKLLLATNNAHKIEEFEKILSNKDLNIELTTPRKLGISLDPEENGQTLYDNAEIKAVAFFKASGIPTIADDTGLEVDALGNAPGVYSARYAGDRCSPKDNRKKLLAEMENVEDRTAHFKTVICFFDGDRPYFADGVCNGKIIPEERGRLGFGYDPIFIPDGYEETFAELSPEEKNKISHRGNAARRLARLFGVMHKNFKNIGFLASGTGSNVEAIVEAINRGKLCARAAVIISNNSNAGVKEKAEKYGIPFVHISSKQFDNDDARDRAIADEMTKYNVDIIAMAGYMKKVGQELFNQFDNKILNIHPALLPKFGGEGLYGMNVHKAVLAAGEKVSGPTIHVADSNYDSGKILAQMKVPVLAGDTPETLQKRVLMKEHVIYVETLQRIILGEIEL